MPEFHDRGAIEAEESSPAGNNQQQSPSNISSPTRAQSPLPNDAAKKQNHTQSPDRLPPLPSLQQLFGEPEDRQPIPSLQDDTLSIAFRDESPFFLREGSCDNILGQLLSDTPEETSVERQDSEAKSSLEPRDLLSDQCPPELQLSSPEGDSKSSPDAISTLAPQERAVSPGPSKVHLENGAKSPTRATGILEEQNEFEICKNPEEREAIPSSDPDRNTGKRPAQHLNIQPTDAAAGTQQKRETKRPRFDFRNTYGHVIAAQQPMVQLNSLQGQSLPPGVSAPSPFQLMGIPHNFLGAVNLLVQAQPFLLGFPSPHLIPSLNQDNTPMRSFNTSSSVTPPEPLTPNQTPRDGQASLDNLIENETRQQEFKYEVFVIENPARCDVCDSKFVDENAVARHKEKNHSQNRQQKEWKCPECGLELTNDTNHMRHILTTHRGDLKHTCGICAVRFTTKKALVTHERHQHGKESYAVRKRKSAKTKSRPGARKKHLELYVCDTCQYQTTVKGNIVRHIRVTHLQERPFVCHICGIASKTKHNLQIHLASH